MSLDDKVTRARLADVIRAEHLILGSLLDPTTVAYLSDLRDKALRAIEYADLDPDRGQARRACEQLVEAVAAVGVLIDK